MDTYLEDLIIRSMEHAADDEARDEVRRVADSLNEAAARIETQCALLCSASLHSVLYLYCTVLVPNELLAQLSIRTRTSRYRHVASHAARTRTVYSTV